jgi:subtilisin family serine protease
MNLRERTGSARWKYGALSLMTALVLSACGGGGGGGAPVSAQQGEPAAPQARTLAAAEAAQLKSFSSAEYRGSDSTTTTVYIVRLQENRANQANAYATSAASTYIGEVVHIYSSAIQGFAVRVPDDRAEAFIAAMRSDPNVIAVEEDRPMYTMADQRSLRPWANVQTNPTWGLDRIDQRNLPLDRQYAYNDSGAGVHAYIIETGIYAAHQDLAGRVESGFTAINDGRGTTACDGHGTHVSATVGGTTYGVAKGVQLVPVRVLDCNGSGSTSGIIAGLDWIVANARRPAVANMNGAADSVICITSWHTILWRS